jgi:hypothetical protein
MHKALDVSSFYSSIVDGENCVGPLILHNTKFDPEIQIMSGKIRFE